MTVTATTLANGAGVTNVATATTVSVTPTAGARVFLAYAWGGPTTGNNMLTTLPTFAGTLARTTSRIVMWNECGENFIAQTDMGVGLVELVGWSGSGTVSITLPTTCLDILTHVFQVTASAGEDISTLCWAYAQGNSTQARVRLPNGGHVIGGYVSVFGNGAGGASRTHTPLGGKTEMTNSEVAEADGYLSMACGYDPTNNTLEGDDANVSCAWGIIGWSLGPEPARPYLRGPVGPVVKNTTTGTTAVTKVAHAIPAGTMLLGRIVCDNSGTSGASPTLTPTDTAANTWAQNVALNDPGAANAGVTTAGFWSFMVNALAAGDSITMTFGTTTPAKAICIDEIVFPVGYTPSFDAAHSATGTGTSTTPTVTSGALTVGELAVGLVGLQGPNSDVHTSDADATNGQFYRTTFIGTFNATALSNVKQIGEVKTITGAGTQTFDPTLGTSRVWTDQLLCFTFTPPAAPARRNKVIFI